MIDSSVLISKKWLSSLLLHIPTYLRMKKVIYIICFYLSGLPIASAVTVTWTGNGDGITWEDPLNWNTGQKPTTMQDVVIIADSVSMSSLHSVNSLRIVDGALHISSTALFQTNGSRNTNPFYALTLVSSSLYVSGEYYIINSQSVMAIDESSRLVIESGGQIDVDGGSGQNGVVNSGLLHIKNNGALIIRNKQCNRGIHNNARVLNEGGIDIGGSGISESIFNYTEANFDNYGSLYLRNAANSAIKNFAEDAAFFNNYSSGIINVNSVIDSRGNFGNSGTILCKSQEEDQFRIFEQGSYFQNFGLIKLCPTRLRSIATFNASLFVNEIGGRIETDDSCPAIASTGYKISVSASFHNYGNITLHLNHFSSGFGISSTFINDGIVSIADAKSSSITIAETGYFENSNSGQINIVGAFNKNYNTHWPAAKIEGEFLNNGKITISSTDSVSWQQEPLSTTSNFGVIDLRNAGASLKFNGGELLNRNCGLIALDKPVVNTAGNFANEGIIYDRNHNVEYGDATNSGLIYEDVIGLASEGIKNYFPVRTRGFNISMPDSLFTTKTLNSGSSIASFEEHPVSFPLVYFWTPKPNVNMTDRYYFQVEGVSGCNRRLELNRKIAPQCNSYKSVTANGASTDFFDRSNWERQLIPGVCENVIINNAMKFDADYKVQFNKVEFQTGSMVEIETGAVLETLGQ